MMDYISRSWKTIALTIAVLLGTLSMLSCSGCATLNKWFSNPNDQATAKVVVQVAVVNALTDHPEWKAPLANITQTVSTYIDGDPTAKADTIMKLVHDQVKWDKLKPQDALVVESMITVIEANLQQQIAGKTVPADVQLTVKTVITWINDAAAMVPAPSAPPAPVATIELGKPSNGLLANHEGWEWSSPALASTEIISPVRHPMLAILLLKHPNNDGLLGQRTREHATDIWLLSGPFVARPALA